MIKFHIMNYDRIRRALRKGIKRSRMCGFFARKKSGTGILANRRRKQRERLCA